MYEALSQHWPEYLMEAALLGGFMVSACVSAVLLGHPASPVVRWIRNNTTLRVLMGAAMGLTAVALIYSPWGEQSGAHMNPATTLTFYLRGKIAAWDAFFYVFAHFVGGAAGVAISYLVLGGRLRHESVNYVVTAPGPFGVGWVWLGEWAISFGMMLTVLYASNDPPLTPYTGVFAGVLVALYIAVEAPLSGMSLNPARTFGSAIVARQWKAFWLYLTAPVLGMLAASAAYATIPNHDHVYCAKLNHCNERRCIFRCEFEQLQALRNGRAGANTGH